MVKPNKVVVAAPIPLQDVGLINWEACILCQKKSGKLIDPSKNPVQALRESGYKSIGANLELLVPHGHKLESGFLVESLRVLPDTENNQEERLGVVESLIKKKAKWHNQCRLKYSSPKFEVTLNHAVVLAAERTASESSKSDTQGQEECVLNQVRTRASLPLVNAKADVCFLCKEPASHKYPLRHCATDNIYKNVKECATKLNDTAILAVISEGDLVAIEAKYHLICLARLYNKISRSTCTNTEDDERVLCEGIAFSNLLLFIQTKLNENRNVTFKMGDIRQSYKQRLAHLLGCSEESISVHSTRFREKILAHFPTLIAQMSGREYILLHSGANLLSSLHKEDQDEDALATQVFLKKIRKGMKASTVKFSGKFDLGCEEACIPPSLLAVVNTLLYGSPVHSQCRATKPVLTICQLIMLNFRESVPKGSMVRNKKNYEPPLPLYLGLSAYGKARDKGGIEEMHQLGLSVSYNRINEVTSQLCRRVVEEAKHRSVLCPSHLKHGLFVAAAVDNIDHNPSSTSSKGQGFHGTGISLFQFPTESNQGIAQDLIINFDDVERPRERGVPELPEFYSCIPDCILLSNKPQCPKISGEASCSMKPTGSSVDHWQSEDNWLSHTHDYISGSKPLSDEMSLSFSCFHAGHENISKPKALNALLPLFPEKCDDPATIKHAMNIVKNITTYLNGDQIPVVCGDQPTYASIKSIQWNWPALYGENHFVALLGPLHIEKAFLRVLGQYCESSGWSSILGNSGIVTLGSAEGLLKVSHIMKARAAHQKIAVALFSLLNDAYENTCDVDTMSLQDWAEERAKHSPTFKFWFILINMVIILLTFVKSIREGNFELYKSSMKNMVPYFFSTNHPQYARWLPVHIRDMETLQDFSPSTHEQFSAGNFVVRKSGRPFSALGLDHAHEQNNARVKAQGGAIGLTEDPSALRRWTIGGPEVQRLLSAFNASAEDDDVENSDCHYEQTPGFQRKFAEHCFALKESFLQLENPFLNETSELIALDTRCVASSEAVNNLHSFQDKGLAAYLKFAQDRLVDTKSSIYETIGQIKSQIFSLPAQKKSESAIAKLKDNLSLFVRLFIICQARDFNLDDFFRHENQLFPPSLSENGDLRSGNKALLVNILENLVGTLDPPQNFDGVVIDGPGLMYELKPVNVTSIAEYFKKVLMPFINTFADTFSAKTLAVAWDLYFNDSTKKVRKMRGEGLRQQDLPRKGGLPKNWDTYLKNSENKTELFTYLAEQLVKARSDRVIVTNVGDHYVASPPGSSRLHGASCANKEEADPRVILHITDMLEHGAHDILVRSNDTDVIVLCVSFYNSMKSAGLQDLWVVYGPGRQKRRFISIKAIAEALGPEKSEALRGFHAFTGCDGTSFFASKGKPSAWTAWKDDPDTTKAFIALGNPVQLSEDGDMDSSVLAALEKYTILLYGADPTSKSVDKARKILFCSGDKPLTAIPPTECALFQHIKRAAYQAGHIWGTALQVDYSPPPAEQFGWVRRDACLEPLWSTLPYIWEACRELDRCGCASDCGTRRCLCRRNSFPCSPACKKCKGECTNNSS